MCDTIWFYGLMHNKHSYQIPSFIYPALQKYFFQLNKWMFGYLNQLGIDNYSYILLQDWFLWSKDKKPFFCGICKSRSVALCSTDQNIIDYLVTVMSNIHHQTAALIHQLSIIFLSLSPFWPRQELKESMCDNLSVLFQLSLSQPPLSLSSISKSLSAISQHPLKSIIFWVTPIIGLF